MTLRALLLDFNAYFASVEQQLDPRLRGRPVAVLPVLAATTCCIAASYEAKRRGVKTGTPVQEARRLCPDIVFVQARPRVYVEMHQRLIELIDAVIPIAEVLSIDEVMCELTGSWQQEAVAVARAREVKRRILSDVGECLTCSIGIAPNRFLAKLASDLHKPDGLTVLRQEDLPQALFGLQLTDLPGVSGAMQARLARAGISTVEALCRADRATLRRVWGGIEGERMYERLRGLEPPLPPGRRASIGHSHVLPPQLRTDAGAYAVLSKLTQKAAVRLRAEGYCAGRMTIALDYRGRPPWVDGVRFAPTRATLDLLKLLAALWAGRPRGRSAAEPVKVSVTLWELTPADQVPLELFGDHARQAGLDAALDRLRRKYGPGAVYFGGAHGALAEAPMRISFTHVPDLRLEADTAGDLALYEAV
ncbi:MAG: DNA polymerase [Thiobacillaceae bacterium]|nr:DNA polymerase [Thiobacillaceae bacterium]